MAVEIHVGRSFGGSFLAVVEKMDLAVRPAEEQESAAADVAGLGIDDRQGEADRDRRVDCVAALLHDGDAHLGSLRMHRRNHGFGSMDRTHGTAAHEVNGEGDDQKHGQWKAQFHHQAAKLRRRAAQNILEQSFTLEVTRLEASPRPLRQSTLALNQERDVDFAELKQTRALTGRLRHCRSPVSLVSGGGTLYI